MRAKRREEGQLPWGNDVVPDVWIRHVGLRTSICAESYTQDQGADARLELEPLEPLLAVVPIRSWESVSLKALQVAMGLSARVVVVQVLTSDRQVDDLRPRWQELVADPAERHGLSAPTLVVKESEYRRVLEPLIEVVQELVQQHPERPLAVVLPELVAGRWYH